MQKVIILLYGSTGDLTFRKILPALEELKTKKLLPEKTNILALGRRDFSNEDYYQFILEKNPQIDKVKLPELVKYLKMQITNSDDYENLKKYLKENTNDQTVVIHYLAVASNLMESTIEALVNNDIINKNKINHKLVFEKPFGSNYNEAVFLNNYLEKYFNEEQIFRVDHYLGKPFVNYLLNLKDENQLLRQLFSPKNISSISIMLKEYDGVLDRGPFYDVTGAISDMFQSHILQIISLITMKYKKGMTHSQIVKAKTKALSKLTFDYESLIYGQYSGYLNEDKVRDNSLTETLFAAKINVNNHFKKVPIYIFTGKNLDEKKTAIIFKMKDGSILTINMYPTKDITIINNGVKSVIYQLQEGLEDYANLIMQIIENNKALFVSDKEILLMHRITDQIKDQEKELMIYKKNFNINEINENF